MPAVAKWTRKTVYVKSSDFASGVEREPEEEALDLWMRDALELIQELLKDPKLKDDLVYQPMHIYTDETWEERIYGEMWTGDWWSKNSVRFVCYIENASGHLLKHHLDTGEDW